MHGPQRGNQGARRQPAAIEPIAAALSGQPQAVAQDDTFFACAQGRLKLRAFADGHGELIFYRRADDTGPKESFYVISPTASPDTLRETLLLAYGVIGRCASSGASIWPDAPASIWTASKGWGIHGTGSGAAGR